MNERRRGIPSLGTTCLKLGRHQRHCSAILIASQHLQRTAGDPLDWGTASREIRDFQTLILGWDLSIGLLGAMQSKLWSAILS